MDRAQTCQSAGAVSGDRKIVATLQALAALVGVTVAPLEGGAFLVCRWNLERRCDSLNDLAEFLEPMGVRS